MRAEVGLGFVQRDDLCGGKRERELGDQGVVHAGPFEWGAVCVSGSALAEGPGSGPSPGRFLRACASPHPWHPPVTGEWCCQCRFYQRPL
ncbi:hypothetical protein Nans01_00050 [Nocardiopsis ansamitocini]|uniref:Uncharacterized protein n=1 Tax=Nocardiopsis ansamitocini TaxID=1670832 RepID=A0A9W6P204_9ACTN|nr:hypothetical protein Nans01_00050 [Nocardiopsis ansamitocini]